ncbi:MAG TPA: HEPN domain-containing protein [Candidatus Saccharimonadales bacterium]|nr:HEPN domain-containing protein [Candidatus Saccharimonadales bacterium]
MTIQELLDKDLIRKNKASAAEIKGAIEISVHYLSRAEGIFKIKYYDIAFLSAYNSMFQAAKALLLKAGYKERGHSALIQALKIAYKGNKDLDEFLDILDSYRQSRHSVQYDGEAASEIDARESINDAKRLIEIAKSIIETH